MYMYIVLSRICIHCRGVFKVLLITALNTAILIILLEWVYMYLYLRFVVENETLNILY
jgi:hypothetical protein